MEKIKIITKDFKSKKAGDEKIMAIWFFLMVGIVVAVIALGVFSFYGKSVNVNSLEAEVLYENIVDCSLEGGVLREDFIKEDFENVFSECGLNSNLFDDSGRYFIEINLTEKNIGEEDEPKKIIEFSSGRNSLKENCRISQEVDAEEFPRCIIRNETVLYYDQKENKLNEGILSIMAVSDNKGKISTGY